ncbi:MAG: ABC transporter permease [Microbacteriaceae bacterium]
MSTTFLRSIVRETWPAALTLLVALVTWEGAVRILQPPAYLVPAPSAVAVYLAANLPSLLHDIGSTVVEIAIVFGLSVLIGIPLGAAAYRSRLFRRTVYPLLVASQTFPKLAVGPLFIVWFGFGQLPIVLLGILLTFFAITSTTLVGMQEVRPESIDLARIMGLSGRRRFLRIELPQALPSVFGGLRLASTLAVVGVVVAEFLGASSGLGYRIVNATGMANTPALFSCLVLLIVIGLLFYGAIALAEWLLLPWRRPAVFRVSAGTAPASAS